uniref:Uncharacterized protein n=1 Tax=Arundo donax TaxID=35708 RepID=A0A0A8YUB8_ARUDO
MLAMLHTREKVGVMRPANDRRKAEQYITTRNIIG